MRKLAVKEVRKLLILFRKKETVVDMNLSFLQTRVIGCMLEKEVTTPDQYPLSLKSLTVACNQKSNREPVMDLSESEVQETLDELTKKRLVRDESGFGSRVVKYKHRFCNTEFSDLQLSAQELAVITVLFLRGAQTPGELRSRTNRMCEFSDVHEVESVLQKMSSADTPLVTRLEREPGKRESRYAHLFSGADSLITVSDVNTVSPNNLYEKNDSLENRVEALEAEVAELKQMMTDYLDKG